MLRETRNYTLLGMVAISAILFLVYGYHQITAVPVTFPSNTTFTINENESLKSVSERLYLGGYITSPLLFRAGMSFFGKDTALQVGGYSFSKAQSLVGVVNAFVEGRPSSPLLSVTIPEGSTSFEVAMILVKAIPSLSVETFKKIIGMYDAEGKLFPSTYFLLPSYKEEDVVKLMLATFTKRVDSKVPENEIQPPLRNINDMLVLASILEGEAKGSLDMKIVSGILLKRLTEGMLLQVDVAKETYKKKGLLEKPINNPGLVAIDAALHPTETSYLYYITGNDGKMYYAKTFEEHKRNIRKYLK